MSYAIIADKEVGGPADTPQAIRRLRRQNFDMLRWIGEPVVVMHRFGNEELEKGIAKECPGCFSEIYSQPRADCQICFGVGFVSIEDDPDFWINTDGRTIVDSDPGTGIHAPLFGGFAQPYITYLIQPDTPTDLFKIDQAGALVRTKQAQGFAPWTPTLYDNDLCVNVTLDKQHNVTDSGDRFILKMVQPITIRGFGRQQQYQQYLIGQQFEMAEVPNGLGTPRV